MRSIGVSEETISEVVQATLPKKEDLLTLQEAAETYRVPYGTLVGWINAGHLPVGGRMPFPAPGGGKVLVDKNDVAYLAENRPKNGRPRKNGR